MHQGKLRKLLRTRNKLLVGGDRDFLILSVHKTNDRWQRNSPHHPTLSAPLKEISLAQILIFTMYSTPFLHSFPFLLGFNDSGLWSVVVMAEIFPPPLIRG